jgi:hypothetical protein
LVYVLSAQIQEWRMGYIDGAPYHVKCKVLLDVTAHNVHTSNASIANRDDVDTLTAFFVLVSR